MGTDVLSLWAKLGMDSSGFNSGLNSAKSDLSSFGSAMKTGFATVAKVGAAAFTATTGAAVAFGKSSVDAGKEFDSSMSQVAATMGTTVDQITELRDFAKEMGASTAFSATQAADALNYMALAGYDAEKSMSMLPNVLNLAASGGMELATASDMITDAQSALGLSMEETTELVDKMAKTASSSNTSVAQLGEAMLQIGGTAKKLKGGTTELTTMLGILADNGIKGAEGGTALRNMLNKLISPSKDATEMMEQLGVALYDSEGNMRSLNDVFIDLRDGMETLSTQAERDQVLSTIFNARDLKSAEALLANVGDRYEELSSKINDAAGAAQDMADTQLDNLTGDITLFKSALEGTQIAISDKLTPALRKFTKFGGESLQKLTTAIEKDGLEGAIDKLSEVIDDGFDIIDSTAPKVLEAGAKLTGNLIAGIAKKSPDIIREGVKVATTLESTLAKQAPEIIQSTVTAMSVLGSELYDNVVTPSWDFIIGELPDLINDGVAGLDFTQAGEFISDNIIKGFNGIADFTDNIDWDVVGTKLGEAMDSIDWSGIIKAAVKAFTSVIKNAPDLIAGFANALDGESQAVLVAYVFAPKFIGAVTSKLASSNLFMSLTGKAGAAGTAAGASFATKFSLGVGAFFAGWSIGTLIREQVGEENVDEFLEPAFENIEEGWKTYGDMWDALEKNGEDAYDKLSSDMEALSGKWSMWQDSFNETMDAYKDGFKNVKDTMKPVDDAIRTTGTLFNNLFQRAGEGIFDLKEDWKVGATSIKDTFSNKISSMKDDWETGCLDIWSKWDKFVDDWKNKNTDFQVGLTTIKGWFSDLGTKISSLASDAYTWGSDLVSSFSDGIEDTFWRVEGALEGFGEKVYDFIHFSEPDKGPLSNFHTFAPDMIDLFAQGIADNAYKAEDAVGTMLDNIKSSFTEDVTPRTIAYGEISSIADTTTEQAIINLNIDGQSMATVLAPLLDVISGKNIMLATRGRQL